MADVKNSNGKVLIILIILVVVLVALLGFFAHNSCSYSKDLQIIRGTLKSDLDGIKQSITTSNNVVKALLKGQGELHLALYGDEENEGIITKLDKSRGVMNELKKKLGERPEPVNPDDLNNLEDCKTEYSELLVSYELCLDLNSSKDDVLILFGQVKNNLTTQVSLLEESVDSLGNQIENWKEIEEKVTEGMEKIDRVYRVNRFWKNVKNVGIGAGAGAVLVFILKAVLK
ncbi:MAG: hypothetical protein PVH61_13910 [Candidatus Aminicenantes bacterium]|jgi:hypothetical protein